MIARLDAGIIGAMALIGLAAPAQSAPVASVPEQITISDPSAQADFGDRYRAGAGVAQNYAEALRWYGLAAAQKDGRALRALGEMAMAGEGARRDEGAALKLWKQAEAAGDPRAPILVADHLFLKTTGVAAPAAPGGQLTIRRSMSLDKIGETQRWYKLAAIRDDRPEVQERARAQALLFDAIVGLAAKIEDRRR